ncbi:MAG: hypothetical protein QW625_00320 [Candidatus Nanoarchaeia archaeon]
MTKNFIQVITTESHPIYDARGFDLFITINEINIRIDPSKKFYDCCQNKEKEFARQKKYWKDTKMLIITHFHNDHSSGLDLLEWITLEELRDFHAFFPSSNLTNNFNEKSKERLELLTEKAASINSIGNYYYTKIKDIEIELREFRHSCYKGFDLGNILMCYFNDLNTNNDIIVSSDVAGPEYRDAAKWIINKDPKLLILDGPYFGIVNVLTRNKNIRYKAVRSLEKAFENLLMILGQTHRLEKILLCHHFARNGKDVLEMYNRYEDKFKLKKNEINKLYDEVFNKADDYGINLLTPMTDFIRLK